MKILASICISEMRGGTCKLWEGNLYNILLKKI